MPDQIDFDPAVDYYQVLGVDRTATLYQVKKAYRDLAKANHPDSTGGNKAKESRFKDVSIAYDVLGDPKRRAQYDQLLAQSFNRGHRANDPDFDLGDIFGQFFQAKKPDRTRKPASPRSKPQAEDTRPMQTNAPDGTLLEIRGNDVYSDVHIRFDRAILGTIVSITTVGGGKVDVRIPPATSSGVKLRLRGKGVFEVGDHYATIQIDIPRDETELAAAIANLSKSR